MNKKMKLIALMAMLFAFSTSLKAQSLPRSGNGDCSMVKEGGRFTYGKNNEATVIIEGTTHTEVHSNGEVKSTLVWTGDCAYVMTVNATSIPGFPVAIGTAISVEIKSVAGNEITYTCTLNGESWTSVMVKKEE
jgi:hypothetical protein